MAAPRCGGREPREAEGDLGLAGGGSYRDARRRERGRWQGAEPGAGRVPWRPRVGAGGGPCSAVTAPRPTPPPSPPSRSTRGAGVQSSLRLGSDTRWEDREPPAKPSGVRSQVNVSLPAVASVSPTCLGKILSITGGI